MKHSILVYPLLAAALCLSACSSDPAAEPAQAKASEVKAPAKAAAKKAPTSRERQLEFRKFLKSFGRKKYNERIALIKEELKKPEYANDPAIRLLAYEAIITYCRTPAWNALSQYDPSAADRELVAAARTIIDDKAIRDPQKLKTFRWMVEYYAGMKDFKKAEEFAREAMALPKLDKDYRSRAYLILADVYRWNEDYPNFKKTVMEAMKIHPVNAANHGAAIALRYGNAEEAKAYWKAANNLFSELCFYSSYNPRKSTYGYGGTLGVPLCDRTADARKFVMDEKNSPRARFEIAALYCMDTMEPEDVAARKSLMNIPAKDKTSWSLRVCLERAYGRGDYALSADLYELVKDTNAVAAVNQKMIYVSALGAIGRKADAIKAAREFAALEKITPMQKLTFLCYADVLEGKDAMPRIKAAKLSNKEEYTLVCSVARQCLLWGMMSETERYAALYEKYFAMPEDRVMTVKYFEKPIYSIADWRAIYDGLDKQYCNIPYRGALDFFETDVATGNRNVTFDPTEKPIGTTEITAAADRYGVHVFLRVEAENAREVEQGFAKAVSPECYFAPGHNQPYVCLGADPVNKSEWTFYTTYNNKGATRLNEKDPARSYRFEYAFSDTDYVIHIFFGWETHYNKLPENGSEYLFEAIVWTPAGGMTWGGTQGPHGVSDWGRLRFDLSKKQLNEIRKEILFKTYKGYKKINFGGLGGMPEDVFATWAADIIGDPVFYRNYLVPLQEKLEKYAKMVKKDMTDEEVEDVYVNALPLMKGLRYEVDELRRKYLEESLMQP